jgi:hypothetical protein
MEEENVQVPVPVEEVEKPKKASGRGKMTQAKVDNLEKARAAKKIYAVERHSKGFRPAAEAKIEKEIQDRAEKLAKDLLEEERKAKERAEFEEWKKNKGKEPEKPAEAPKTPKKKATKATKAPTAKAPRAPKPKTTKPKPVQEVEEEPEEYHAIPYPFVRTTASWNIDDFID